MEYKPAFTAGTVLGGLGLGCTAAYVTLLIVGKQAFIDIPPRHDINPQVTTVLGGAALALTAASVSIQSLRKLQASQTRSSFDDNLSVPWIAFGIVLTVLFFTTPMLSKRGISASGWCVNNLRQIDAAKQIWAMEHHNSLDATPTIADLTPYLNRRQSRDFPQCPLGGIYRINAVKDPPTCSFVLLYPPPGQWGTNHTLPHSSPP
jgi:hypothetical protein